MDWSLAIVALTLLGVAAVSGRLSGTPVTPAMLFVVVGLLVGPKVLGEIDVDSSSSAVRTLAEATLALVLFCDASRIDLGQLRREVGVPRAPPRHRPPADDRARCRCGGWHLRPAEHRRGSDPRNRVGADRRRTWPGGRNRAAGPKANSPGPERRERAQRRDLRAAAVRRRGRGRCGVRDLAWAQRGHPSARGDRLRRGRRCCGRSADRGHRHLRRSARSDRASVAAGHPRCRRGSRIRDRCRAPRVGLHRGVRRGHGVSRGAQA